MAAGQCHGAGAARPTGQTIPFADAGELYALPLLFSESSLPSDNFSVKKGKANPYKAD